MLYKLPALYLIHYRLIRHRTLFVLAWLLLVSAASAHEIRPAIIDVRLASDGAVSAAIRLNLEARLAGIATTHKDTEESASAPQYRTYRRLGPEPLRALFDDEADAFIADIDLIIDGEPLALQLQSVSIPDVGDPALARDSIVTLQGQLPNNAQTLTWRGHERLGASVLRIDDAEGAPLYSEYLQAGDISADIDVGDLAPVSISTVFAQYVAVGFAHIVPKGIDHILFVIGLYLLSPAWRPLLWQISAFTLAHTLTLAMSMLGWVALPASIVEPLIAASIVYVAVENIFQQRLTRFRPVLVFVFGLIHGLGFASVLSDIGLTASHFATGLIAFNIGVELGQLSVIAFCVLGVGIWFGRQPWYRSVIVIPSSLVIACIGAFWLIERVSG
jgi:hypothetical protein